MCTGVGLDGARLVIIELGSVYFTENSDYQSLKNRSCITVFSSCSVTLTVGEPLGDVSGSANHDFRTSVTGISGEIDASLELSHLFCLKEYLSTLKWDFPTDIML